MLIHKSKQPLSSTKNQLKYIVPRFDHLQAQHVSVKTAPQQHNTTTDIFESLVNEQTPPNERDERNPNVNREEHEETEQNRNVNRIEPERGAQVDEDTPVITGGWCNVNQGNVL